MSFLHVSAIEFDWVPVVTVSGDRYTFPMPAKVLGKVQDSAAVYCWDAGEDPDGRCVIYIGETSNLRRRVNNYLKMHGPEQKTNVRLFDLFSQINAQNRVVTLSTLRFDDFRVGENTVTQSHLKQKWVRDLLEGLLVGQFIDAYHRVLNLSVDNA